MKTLKKLLTKAACFSAIILTGALASTVSVNAQSSSYAFIQNKTLGTNLGTWSTNFAATAVVPFRLEGQPGQTSASFAFQLKMYAVTNGVAITSTNTYLNTVTAPAHAKYVIPYSYSTTTTSNSIWGFKFGVDNSGEWADSVTYVTNAIGAQTNQVRIVRAIITQHR